MYNKYKERWCHWDMPKKADEKLKTDKGTYKSRIKASQQYDQNNVDNIRVRVPKGWREQMQEYALNSGKYGSVNGMICALIKQEIPYIKSEKEVEDNE